MRDRHATTQAWWLSWALSGLAVDLLWRFDKEPCKAPPTPPGKARQSPAKPGKAPKCGLEPAKRARQSWARALSDGSSCPPAATLTLARSGPTLDDLSNGCGGALLAVAAGFRVRSRGGAEGRLGGVGEARPAPDVMCGRPEDVVRPGGASTPFQAMSRQSADQAQRAPRLADFLSARRDKGTEAPH